MNNCGTQTCGKGGRRFRLGTVTACSLIRLYQVTLGLWLGGHCRFEPSCSQYALEAVQLHGVCRGLTLAAHRLWRCRPAYPGGDDPVPQPESPAYALPNEDSKASTVCRHS